MKIPMEDINNLTSFHYLLHPYKTLLVTCCGRDGHPNIITIAWLTPVSSNPPILVMSLSPKRYSYHLISEIGEFVINVATKDIAQQALICGRTSGRDTDKFSITGLTPIAAKMVKPPAIEECIASLECRIIRDIECGDHHLILADVLTAYTRKGILNPEGLYDLEQVELLLHLGKGIFAIPSPESFELSR